MLTEERGKQRNWAFSFDCRYRVVVKNQTANIIGARYGVSLQSNKCRFLLSKGLFSYLGWFENRCGASGRSAKKREKGKVLSAHNETNWMNLCRLLCSLRLTTVTPVFLRLAHNLVSGQMNDAICDTRRLYIRSFALFSNYRVRVQRTIYYIFRSRALRKNKTFLLTSLILTCILITSANYVAWAPGYSLLINERVKTTTGNRPWYIHKSLSRVAVPQFF